MPDFSIETKMRGIIAGIDEAGRGPWAGPVVAAAIILWREGAALPGIPEGLNDSKKLSAVRRKSLYESLISRFSFGVGIVDVATIDTVNILQATKLAMQRAVAAMGVDACVVLVDGPHAPVFSCRSLSVRSVPVVGGDAISLSIAAASIIAKVSRDHIMQQLHQEFPHYNWASNAGYGTADHQEALRTHGVSPHHRRSYRPIRELLERSVQEPAHA